MVHPCGKGQDSKGPYGLLVRCTSIFYPEICAVLGYYAEYSGNSVPTFWERLSVPPSRVSIGPICRPLYTA